MHKHVNPDLSTEIIYSFLELNTFLFECCKGEHSKFFKNKPVLKLYRTS